ncbi:MAG: S53 family peptidase [Actinomycetota bacterium]
MKRLVLIALVALGVTASSGDAAGPVLKPFCTVGPIRCQSALRLDLPVVANATAAHDGYGAQDLQSAYNLASAAATRGGNQTVALVDAYDDPTIESDMNTYRPYYGLPPCTTANGCFRKVNQDGEQGNYPLANPDWDPEIALDVEMVSAICPKCHILLVEANSADEATVMSNPVQHSDLGASVDTAVNLGATEVSNSYGSVGPEPDQTFWDHYYDHPGVAITASAGDEDYGTIWPAASPYVTAVGGTELVADPTTARGWSESVWGSVYPGVVPNEAQGTGSGCSLWEAKPAWQHDAGCAGRTVADVSAVADGVAIYDSSVEIGGWGVVAGTSISSPIIASVYALAGNAKSVVYGSYPYAHTSKFNDVTVGSNFTPSSACGYLCTAEPGYDGPTGWGTPNGTGGF